MKLMISFSAPLTPTIRRYLNLPAQGVAVKSKGKAKAAPPRPAPAPIASTSSAPAQAAAKPVPLRVAALVTKPSRAALRPHPVEHPEPRQTAHASTSRQPSPKKVSPKKVARVEPVHSAPPYKSIALAPLPTRPEVAPLNGRSLSHTILPTVHPSTSIAENVPRSTRPILPQSYSTTALPTDSSNFVSRFATGPIRIIRSAPIQDDSGDPDGFIYPQTFGGPSRPTQHLGHGRKPIGPARRVVTAPTPSKEVLGYPTRTPAANRILSRTVRDKVDEVEEQPILVLSNTIDSSTPVPTRQKIHESPLTPRVESPLLPVLPPDVEDVRDTSMLEPINGRELESPVPVEVAAVVPLPDEVHESEKEATTRVDLMDEPEPLVYEVDEVLEPVAIEAILETSSTVDEPISTVDEALSDPAPALDEAIDEPEPAVEKTPLPIISHDQSMSVPEPIIDEVIAGPVSAVEETVLSALSLDQATPITEIEIDETMAEPVSAVDEVTVSAAPLDESSKAISMIDGKVQVPPTMDEATHAPMSTVEDTHPVRLSDQPVYIPASLVEETPVPMSLEKTQSTTMPSANEETTAFIAPEVSERTVIEEVETSPAPTIFITVPASTTENAHPSLQSPTSSNVPTTMESEPEIEPHVQAAASEIVEVEVTEDLLARSAPTQIAEELPVASTSTQIVEDLPAAPTSTHIAEDLPPDFVTTKIADDPQAASASTQTAKRVITPVPDIQVQESTSSESEIDVAIKAAPSLPLDTQLPIRPEQTLDQVDTSKANVQSKTKAPSETKTNAVTTAPIRSANTVTRAPSRSAQSRPPVKAVQTLKTTSAPAPAPPRKPPVPRAAAVSRPIKPVERKTFRPVTAAQTAAAASLAKVRNAQAVAQAEAAKPRVPSATITKSAVVEPRSRVPSAASSNSHGVTAASTKSTNTTTAPAPVVKTTQSRLLAPTKASASRAATTVSHPTTKITTSAIASNPALPPVRKEKIKLKAALPSFRPVRNAVRSTSGPGTGTWIASSTSNPVSRAAAVPLPHSPVSTKSVAKPETIALPPSPIHRPETMALPASPTSGASRMTSDMQPALLPLPTSPPLVAAEVPLPGSPISQASQLRSRLNRAASPAISALQARLATPSRNSSAPTMSDQESDSENEDEASGVTFKVKSGGRPQSGMKMKMKLKQGGTGDLMEFSAPARMDKVWIGSTTPMYTPGRKALVIRDANLASPLVRKVVNEE